MFIVFLRTIAVYTVLITVIRVMGKRQIGELQLSEFVTTLLLSELAAQPISDHSIPLLYSVIPAIVLLSVEIILSFIITKVQPFKKIFNGKPSIIISRGKLQQKELSKIRLSVEELMSELRLKGIFNIDDVEYAILEPNGKLSVYPKAEKRPANIEESGIQPAENGIALNVIVDGHVNADNLTKLGKNMTWLKKRLSAEKQSGVKTIFLMTVDSNDDVVIIPKEES